MGNKLLLIEDVESLGRSGDIVNVKPGYARNFLLPQGVAVIADRQTIRMQARLQDERQKKAAEDKKESEAMSEKINGLTVTKVVKVDHEGHMYGSVTAADIVHQMKEEHGVEIEKRFVQLKHPVKEIGVSTIHLRLKEGIVADIILKVVPEEAHTQT